MPVVPRPARSAEAEEQDAACCCDERETGQRLARGWSSLDAQARGQAAAREAALDASARVQMTVIDTDDQGNLALWR